MKNLPNISVSEQMALAFAKMPPELPHSMQILCDSLLIDVAGLCVAARHTDYVRATFRASDESGDCIIIMLVY